MSQRLIPFPTFGWRSRPVVALAALLVAGCSADDGTGMSEMTLPATAGGAGMAASTGGLPQAGDSGQSQAGDTAAGGSQPSGGAGAAGSAAGGDTGSAGSDTGGSAGAAGSGAGGEPGGMAGGGAQDTWGNFAQQFFVDYCVSCHNDDNVGVAERDYRVLANVVDEGAEIACGLSKSEEDWMARGCSDFPPARQFPAGAGAMPSDADRDRLIAWIDAGLPE